MISVQALYSPVSFHTIFCKISGGGAEEYLLDLHVDTNQLLEEELKIVLLNPSKM
jgi:hypothetical protein